MAGGEGTRLRPLTSLRPKPMVPIVNRPIMEHIVGLCRWHGIDEIVATLQFMPQMIQDHFGDGEEWGVGIDYAVEDTPRGTAGSVRNAKPLLGGERFLVISGDALTDIDLRAAVAAHETKGAAVTIVLKRVPDPLEFGVVITDGDGRVERFVEKPTWGQVFSDTINTGIYVIEPDVLGLIPETGQFDFSSDLFPLLMKKGYPIFGHVAEGYWADIGSPQAYMQAHWDVLDHKVGVYVPGIQAAGDVWIGEGADIDRDALIGDKVVIGSNVTVRAGARIGDYAVIGDSCLIGNGAEVTRSIIGSDSFVGTGSEVRGAVLCRRVDVRARARIVSGAVIGDEAYVGLGAAVGADVSVFPYKRIEPGAMQTTSLIWESTGVRTLFGADGVSGLTGIDITPELALRLSQAYATTLPTGGHVAFTRDQSRGARMVKRAMTAGLNSAGINVRDLRVASSAVNRYTTRESGCVGGVHVCASSSDPQSTEIHFYDTAGLDISVAEEKRVERFYFRQEFRRSFFDQMGEILYPAHALEYYTAGMLDALGVSDARRLVRIPQPHEARLKVVAQLSYGVASIVAPQVSRGFGIDLVALQPFLDSERSVAVATSERDLHVTEAAQAVSDFRADFGAVLDAAAERLTLIAGDGRVLDGPTGLHALVTLYCAAHPGGRVAVPRNASRVVERIAEAAGCSVLRCGLSTRAMSLAGLSDDVGLVGDSAGGFMFPAFLSAFDAVMTLGATARLVVETGRRLDEVVDSLPPWHLFESSVPCPARSKGAVMREVAEASAGMRVDMTEGIRVEGSGGWALVVPDTSEPTVKVYAEADDDETARAMLERYATIVSGVVAASI